MRVPSNLFFLHYLTCILVLNPTAQHNETLTCSQKHSGVNRHFDKPPTHTQLGQKPIGQPTLAIYPTIRQPSCTARPSPDIKHNRLWTSSSTVTALALQESQQRHLCREAHCGTDCVHSAKSSFPIYIEPQRSRHSFYSPYSRLALGHQPHLTLPYLTLPSLYIPQSLRYMRARNFTPTFRARSPLPKRLWPFSQIK